MSAKVTRRLRGLGFSPESDEGTHATWVRSTRFEREGKGWTLYLRVRLMAYGGWSVWRAEREWMISKWGGRVSGPGRSVALVAEPADLASVVAAVEQELRRQRSRGRLDDWWHHKKGRALAALGEEGS